LDEELLKDVLEMKIFKGRYSTFGAIICYALDIST
jgi:hypothetical protein